jgi:hypothetical protein
MTNIEREDGTTRDDLVQRVALMEEMIAEGRQSTARFGWIFVMWGLTYFAAMAWCIYLPFKDWAWPVCICATIAINSVVMARRKRASGSGANQRSRSIEAIWQVFGVAISLYVIGAIASGLVNTPAYYAAILFFIGVANGISARILRWGAQGLVAAIWWGCGIAMFFFHKRNATLAIFLIATFFGMILFGVYAMWLERRRAVAEGQTNA